MAFTLTQFCSTRPYLYHLTSPRNLELLLETRLMRSTAQLLHSSGEHQWLGTKRSHTVTVNVDGRLVDLRDQQPLYEGKTTLEGGWAFEDLVRALNEFVFFWPGWADKPIDYGTRHYERYESDGPIILRVSTAKLFDANGAEPFFCKYNSGSPRTTQGYGSPRGPNTFVRCHQASYTASNVVEVTYRDTATLPAVIDSSRHPFGPWKRHRVQ